MSPANLEKEDESEDFVLGPFEDGYIIEAVIRAQTMCGLLGRDLLRDRIQAEFLVASTAEADMKIFGPAATDILKRLGDRQVWRLLRKYGIVDHELHTSLQEFTTYRNELAHDVFGRFQYETDQEKRAEIRGKLVEMISNFSTLVDLGTRFSSKDEEDVDRQPP